MIIQSVGQRGDRKSIQSGPDGCSKSMSTARTERRVRESERGRVKWEIRVEVVSVNAVSKVQPQVESPPRRLPRLSGASGRFQFDWSEFIQVRPLSANAPLTQLIDLSLVLFAFH